MDQLVDDYEPRKQKQKSRQGHCGRNVRQRRDEKPEHCHYGCRDYPDRQCEKILEP